MCKRGPRERGREKEGVTGLGVGLLLTAGLQPFFSFLRRTCMCLMRGGRRRGTAFAGAMSARVWSEGEWSERSIADGARL